VSMTTPTEHPQRQGTTVLSPSIDSPSTREHPSALTYATKATITAEILSTPAPASPLDSNAVPTVTKATLDHTKKSLPATHVTKSTLERRPPHRRSHFSRFLWIAFSASSFSLPAQ
jgi:hypothetical protein